MLPRPFPVVKFTTGLNSNVYKHYINIYAEKATPQAKKQ